MLTRYIEKEEGKVTKSTFELLILIKRNKILVLEVNLILQFGNKLNEIMSLNFKSVFTMKKQICVQFPTTERNFMKEAHYKY